MLGCRPPSLFCPSRGRPCVRWGGVVTGLCRTPAKAHGAVRLIGRQVMPRDGAIIFADLIGKADLVRVACEKCGRDGSFRLHRLIEDRGRDAKLIDWLDELTATCPKKIARDMNDPCGARCPDLPRVL